MGAYGSGPRWLDRTGSREVESSEWKLADGLMWEVRKKKQEGALGFQLELLGDSDVY